MFNGSVRYMESGHIRNEYDFTKDILARKWDPHQALATLAHCGKKQIGDALLDQEVFAGVGNIIKNEVLSLERVRPDALIKNLSTAKRRAIIARTRPFSQQFLRWRRKFELLKHLKVHRRKECPYCGRSLLHEHTGSKQRMSHYCRTCQHLTAR